MSDSLIKLGGLQAYWGAKQVAKKTPPIETEKEILQKKQAKYVFAFDHAIFEKIRPKKALFKLIVSYVLLSRVDFIPRHVMKS